MNVRDMSTGEIQARLQFLSTQLARPAGEVPKNQVREFISEGEELMNELDSRNLEQRMRQPVSDPAPQGQPGTAEERAWARLSEDERLFRFGSYLQQVAATQLPAGRKLGNKYATGMISQELMRSTGLEGATPSLGGFLIDSGISAQLMSGVEAKSVLYPKTRKIALQANSNAIKIPGVDETSRASTRWGGILAYWENEGASITASKPKFRNIELALNKLTALVYVTDEILEDANVLADVVVAGYTQEMGFRVDDAILNGTGAGQPLGILNGPSLVSVTGYTAATVAAQDVTNMFARLVPSSHGNAEWYANVNTLPTMLRMSLGNNNYAPLWMPDQQLYNRPRLTLLGKPVNFVEQCASVGTVGDLLLLDLSQYVTISKGLKTATSIHVQFTTDETAFRFIWRIDGQPGWHSAVTPYKGSDTISPFVALATRT